MTESLDTNVLLRLILDDVPALKKRVVAHLMQGGTKYYLDDSVISETVYVLTKLDCSREYICEALQPILQNPIFVCNKELFADIFPFYLNHPSLSFEDCYLTFKVAQQQCEPIWTLDHKFAAQSPAAKEI